MGISKAMMEKVIVAKSRQGGESTVICGTRYGNVMASRGYVIPLFVELIHANKELTLTDPNMTRFRMTLDAARDLVLFAFSNGKPGDIFVQKAPAATVGVMTQALCELMWKPSYPTRVIVTRHGDQRYESLLSREEMACAIDMGDYYRIPPDLRDLNYAKYVDLGEKNITNADEYNSDNTVRLDVADMKLLLNKLRFIQAASRGEIIDPEE
jgi:UDP-glucose 4-epimerase